MGSIGYVPLHSRYTQYLAKRIRRFCLNERGRLLQLHIEIADRFIQHGPDPRENRRAALDVALRRWYCDDEQPAEDIRTANELIRMCTMSSNGEIFVSSEGCQFIEQWEQKFNIAGDQS